MPKRQERSSTHFDPDSVPEVRSCDPSTCRHFEGGELIIPEGVRDAGWEAIGNYRACMSTFHTFKTTYSHDEMVKPKK